MLLEVARTNMVAAATELLKCLHYRFSRQDVKKIIMTTFERF